MDPKLLDQINAAFLTTFVVLVVLAIFRIGKRAYDYRKAGLPIPALLPRDFFLFSGLGLPFLGTLIFRAFGITPREESWYLLWILISGFVGIFGVAYWVWYEYFKVEKS